MHHIGNKDDKRRKIFPVARLNRIEIIGAQGGGNNGYGKTGLHQGKIHEQPCGASVAIDEGMDVDQPGVEQGGRFDRMTELSQRRDAGDG